MAPREVEEYLDTHSEEWTAIAEADPHDAADILEELGEDAATDLLADLHPDNAADVLEEMQDELAADILEELDPEKAADFLEGMPADEAADLVGALDPEAREEIFEAMADPAEADVRRLLAYPPDSAGGLMTTEVAKLPVGMTAGEAIERVRQMIDDDDTLVGVLSFRDLVFKRPGVGLEEAMIPNPVAVNAMADREEAADLTQRYHLFSIPVVDNRKRLLGMVTNDELIEAIQAEASEDFAVATGAGAGETIFTPVLGSVRMRLPWLSLNLVMALLVAFVIERQTGIISDEPVLAALMPVIALLGGNGGFQSLAVVIRSLATDDVPRSQVPQVVGRQFAIGMLNGLTLGLLAGLLAMVLIDSGIFSSVAPPLEVGGVVALAAFGNVSVAGLAGASIPLILRKLGADPAQASSIFLTLITDLVGFGGFLLVAAALL
jgi:magnesium transporter